LEVLDLLVRARELTAAVRARTLLAAGDRLAHDGGVQLTGAMLRKFVGLGVLRPLVQENTKHLRDDVAGALDRHGIADAHAQALNLVLVVQRRILHHDTADGDRLELGDRRQRAGTADLDLDRLYGRGRLLGRELV